MKILHLWLSDSPQVGGGGAGSMFRIHTNMRKAGYESTILCEIKRSNDPYVRTKPSPDRVETALRKVTSNLGLNEIHRLSSFKLHEHEAYREADIVNIHGMLNGFINFLALPKLSVRKPTVITMRSMWCMTGHCAFSLDCARWKTGCGRCPYPDAYPPIKRDATRIEWKMKRRAFGRSKVHLVALSHWLTALAGQSYLHHLPINTIHNGVDCEAYQPLSKQACRELLGLKKPFVLMFMAVSMNDYRKGGDLLIEALKQLPPHIKDNTTLLLLGNNPGNLSEQAGIDICHLGYVSHHRLKSMAYSAADLFVIPTRAESFGQVILESMACGTPVGAFDIGPMPELVRHGITGCLAKAEDPLDLAKNIHHILENADLRDEMGRHCRDTAVEAYSTRKEVDNYIALYRQILEER
jgi:glycosyltransferase involved in cell wall biosynthesis